MKKVLIIILIVNSLFGYDKLFIEEATKELDNNNVQQAITILEKYSELGNPYAFYGLSDIYFKEDYHLKNLQKSKDLLYKAVNILEKDIEKNDSEAMYILASIYGRKKFESFGLFDENKSMLLLKKAVDLNNSDAMNQLAFIYQTNNTSESIKLLEKSANLNNAYAADRLAIMYESDLFKIKDDKKYIYWLKKAAEMEYEVSMKKLANEYSSGEKILKDNSQAKIWFKKLIEKYSNFSSYNSFGDFYFDIKDYKNAKLMYQKASIYAEKKYKGTPYSDFAANPDIKIGDMYLYGYGVLKDYKQAFSSYSRAYDFYKSSFVIRKLSYMYLNGYGVLKDEIKSFNLISECSNTNSLIKNEDCYFSLGLHYLYGWGTNKNLKNAKEWLQKAYDNGYEEDVKKLWNEFELWKY